MTFDRTLNYIKQLYNPIQPTVNQSAENITYKEFLPNIELQPFIYCYWELKTEKVLVEPFIYKVVADGCVDIFFDLHKADDNFVMGFCRQYTEFPLENSFHYIGVRFLPTMFPVIFKIDASELRNRFERLALVVPFVSNFIANEFNSKLQFSEIKELFDKYFLELISAHEIQIDKRLHEAVKVILKSSGVVDVQKDLNTGVSSRQLRRLFEYYVGDTPKIFSKVIRFQNILKAKPSNQSLRKNKLFFDVGYYDQAHFIKEFKKFYGVTPTKAFGR